ncbi:hypothetical protein [Sunxiuqinia sp. sy24]|uniref:hypothetical protein n=1 Tax=Sunxiuqinia sp. sy24 TaxID=3461495 RepID=UPI0040453D47
MIITQADKIYQSFIEHELIKEKYQLKVSDLPQKTVGPDANEKIIDTIRLLIKEVERGANKTDKEIIEFISKSLNE